MFQSYKHMQLYKNWDYRCLAPGSHEDPTKWGVLNGFKFGKAASNKQLKKVRTIKYDKNFNNWIDPGVFKKFTKKSTVKKAWAATYGFNVTRNQRWHLNKDNSITSDGCRRSCNKLVRLDFQQNCIIT